MERTSKVKRALAGRRLSDEEIWSAIRYLDTTSRRGSGDLIAVLALFWGILLLCAIYLLLQLQR